MSLPLYRSSGKEILKHMDGAFYRPVAEAESNAVASGIVDVLNRIRILENIVADHIETIEAGKADCAAGHGDDDCENCDELDEMLIRFSGGMPVGTEARQ